MGAGRVAAIQATREEGDVTPICCLCLNVSQNPVRFVRPINNRGHRYYEMAEGCMICVNAVLQVNREAASYLAFFENNPNFNVARKA